MNKIYFYLIDKYNRYKTDIHCTKSRLDVRSTGFVNVNELSPLPINCVECGDIMLPEGNLWVCESCGRKVRIKNIYPKNQFIASMSFIAPNLDDKYCEHCYNPLGCIYCRGHTHFLSSELNERFKQKAGLPNGRRSVSGRV